MPAPSPTQCPRDDEQLQLTEDGRLTCPACDFEIPTHLVSIPANVALPAAVADIEGVF